MAARLFRLILRAFPPSISSGERDEMAETFSALLASSDTVGRRLKVILASLGRLPWLAVVEWKDHLTAGRGAGVRSGTGLFRQTGAVRQGIRSLTRTPSFTWSVVLLLGLGVGSVTTIFSVVDHVVLRSLPYPAADRLVKLEGSHAGPTFDRLVGIRAAERIAAVTVGEVSLTGTAEPSVCARLG